SGAWKEATLHADCYIYVEGDYYSAPHIHRHKKLRVKLTENQVEIFLALERLAVHPRCRHRIGRRIFIEAHFPPASKAYYEATPQNLLSQSRFIHPELNRLFVELFDAAVRASCAAAPKRSIRPAMTSRASASLQRSPACATITSSGCRTSRPCSPRRANKWPSTKSSAKLCAGPEIRCCVTPPQPRRRGSPRPSFAQPRRN